RLMLIGLVLGARAQSGRSLSLQANPAHFPFIAVGEPRENWRTGRRRHATCMNLVVVTDAASIGPAAPQSRRTQPFYKMFSTDAGNEPLRLPGQSTGIGDRLAQDGRHLSVRKLVVWFGEKHAPTRPRHRPSRSTSFPDDVLCPGPGGFCMTTKFC